MAQIKEGPNLKMVVIGYSGNEKRERVVEQYVIANVYE